MPRRFRSLVCIKPKLENTRSIDADEGHQILVDYQLIYQSLFDVGDFMTNSVHIFKEENDKILLKIIYQQIFSKII